MKFTFKITELTHRELSDFLCTALFQSFWANVDYDVKDEEGIEIESQYETATIEEAMASILLNGKTITISDKEDGQEWKVDLDTLLKGFDKVAENRDYRHHVWNFITQDYDYYDADIILQFAIFGEETYA